MRPLYNVILLAIWIVFTIGCKTQSEKQQEPITSPAIQDQGIDSQGTEAVKAGGICLLTS